MTPFQFSCVFLFRQKLLSGTITTTSTPQSYYRIIFVHIYIYIYIGRKCRVMWIRVSNASILYHLACCEVTSVNSRKSLSTLPWLLVLSGVPTLLPKWEPRPSVDHPHIFHERTHGPSESFSAFERANRTDAFPLSRMLLIRVTMSCT